MFVTKKFNVKFLLNPFPTELETNFKCLIFSKKDRIKTEQRNTKIKSQDKTGDFFKTK